MRYAVPITDGKVSEHFGRCSYFAFFDVDETRNAIIKKEIIIPPGYEPGVLPTWLAEEGVSVVIANGVGSRAQSLFKENHIKVIANALEDDPEKAVLRYREGILAVGDSICDQ